MKKLSWQAKGLIVSGICIILLRIIITVTILPTYKLVNIKDKADAIRQLNASEHRTRVLLAIWVLAIIVGMVFGILEYIRAMRKSK
jgi:heme/copper-type cytochrome/quinol oxidase subunit 2